MGNLDKYEAMKKSIKEFHESLNEIELIEDKSEYNKIWLMLAREMPGCVKQTKEIGMKVQQKALEILNELQKQGKLHTPES
jgi:hypothetical protein